MDEIISCAMSNPMLCMVQLNEFFDNHVDVAEHLCENDKSIIFSDIKKLVTYTNENNVCEGLQIYELYLHMLCYIVLTKNDACVTEVKAILTKIPAELIGMTTSDVLLYCSKDDMLK